MQNEISIDGIKVSRNDKTTHERWSSKGIYLYTIFVTIITKATDVMSDYYIYIIVFVLVLSLIVCFYYSRIITKPLLKVNEATKKIMEFQFQDKLSIKSKMKLESFPLTLISSQKEWKGISI
ncbi:hypothetical protein ACT7DH_05945 [Bacillus pacificus]